MEKRKLVSRILAGTLSVLGFAGCDGLGGNEDMYGCPIVDFQVKGTVLSEEDVPLEGIRVVVRTAWDNADDNADTVYTNAKGEFNSHELSTIAIDQQKVYFDDTDGENKGGAFKSDSIALEKMDKKQLKKGNGWFEGQFEYTAPVVKLSKEEKKPEE